MTSTNVQHDNKIVKKSCLNCRKLIKVNEDEYYCDLTKFRNANNKILTRHYIWFEYLHRQSAEKCGGFKR